MATEFTPEQIQAVINVGSREEELSIEQRQAYHTTKRLMEKQLKRGQAVKDSKRSNIPEAALRLQEMMVTGIPEIDNDKRLQKTIFDQRVEAIKAREQIFKAGEMAFRIAIEAGPIMAGGAAGAALATYRKAKALATTVYTALGNFGGELIGQKTGLVPQSDLMLGLAIGLPVVGSTIAGTTRFILRALPGADVQLQKMLIGLAKRTPAKFITRGKVSSEKLYKEVDDLGSPRIPFEGTKKALKEIEDEAVLERIAMPELAAKTQEGREALNDVANLVTGFEGDVPFRVVRASMKVIKARMKSINRASPEFALLQRLRGSIQNDLDIAGKTLPQSNAVLRLNAANRAFALESSKEDFTTAIINNGIKQIETTNGIIDVFRPLNVLTWMKNPKNKDAVLFRKTLGKQKVNEIQNYLKQLAREFPKIEIEAGGAALSTGRRVLFASAAGAMSGATAGALGGGIFGIGGAIGAFGASILLFEPIADAIMFAEGRAFITQVLRATQGKFGRTEAALVAAFIGSAARSLEFIPREGKQKVSEVEKREQVQQTLATLKKFDPNRGFNVPPIAQQQASFRQG